MKCQHLYLPLITAGATPIVIVFALDAFLAKKGVVSAFADIIGWFPGFLHVILLALIPFMFLVLETWFVSRRVDSRKLEFVFSGGYIAVFGMTVLGQLAAWVPQFAGEQSWHTGSRRFFTLTFLSVISTFLLLVGSFIGSVLSDLLVSGRK